MLQQYKLLNQNPNALARHVLQKIVYFYMCVRACICVCVCVVIYTSQHICGGQRTASWSWLSPLATWGLGIKLRLSHLALGVFTH